MLILACIAYAMMKKQKDTLHTLSKTVGGCSDEYTQVPVDSLTEIGGFENRALWIMIMVITIFVMQMLSLIGFVVVSCTKDTKPARLHQ